MVRSRSFARSSAALAIAVLSVAMVAAPVAAAAPTFDSFSDGPFDDVVVDCGGYQIHEVSTFSARVTLYDDGTSRVQAVIDGWLYRSDDPGTVIGTEHARTVRSIDGTIAKVTGNPWHILLYGEGMTAHDAGMLLLDFQTREIFNETGTHPVLDGDFDFASLCEA
ncbi:MAG TPA: hypothetical protein VHR16_08885 [Candidatus Limnocylindrales bacterium]|nr:hypothetical protein [Candidatus Limnocylindrales bacterium]